MTTSTGQSRVQFELLWMQSSQFVLSSCDYSSTIRMVELSCSFTVNH